MKLFNYDITLKNIKSYIQGKSRLLVKKYGAEFIQLEEHIQEQIVWREKLALPECIKNKQCYCGCDMPDMLYADKTCERNCYPEMMNKETWENYKKQNNITNDNN